MHAKRPHTHIGDPAMSYCYLCSRVTLSSPLVTAKMYKSGV